MELLETQNPERKKLLETSERHKRELEREVKHVSERTEKVLKNTLIIGGTLAVTYLLVTQLSSGRKKKRSTNVHVQAEPNIQEEPADQTPGIVASIGSKIADTALLLLLDMAKDALAEFLKTRKKENADS